MVKMRPLLPYNLKPVGDGFVLPLNRDYFPLGVTRSSDVVYYDSPEYASLHLPDNCINRSILLDGEYFFMDEDSPLSGSKVDRCNYIFRLWWALHNLGLKCPNLPIPAMETSAKRFGLDFQYVLTLSEVLP